MDDVKVEIEEEEEDRIIMNGGNGKRPRPAPQLPLQQTKRARPAHSIFDTNDGELCVEYIQGVASPADRQAMSDKNYEAKLKLFALHQAKAAAALSELMPEIRARPPPSALTELKDLKREIATARSKEKELEASISKLTHKDKVFSARCASYESQLLALEAENKKSEQEFMVTVRKHLEARAAGYAEGIEEWKTMWLNPVEFLNHLTQGSLQYFDYGFDSCQKQAEQQGFVGLLNKDSALKEVPKLKGWECCDQPEQVAIREK